MAIDNADGNDSQSAPVVSIGSESEFDELLANNGTVLVDFHADWCGPCKIMGPRIKSLAEESNGIVAKIDVDAHPDLAARFDVRSIPTFVAFENGSVKERLVGVQETEILASTIE